MWIMPDPTSETPKRGRKARETERRSPLSRLLLREDLGFDYDWIDRWEENGEVKEESLAPESLPPFIADNFAEAAKKNADAKTERGIKATFDGYMNGVRRDIDRLVAGGCNRRVIYCCLVELSPHREAMRQGHRRASKLGPDEEYEQLDEYEDKPEPTTREHTGIIKREADLLRHLIYVHRNALQLASDAQNRPLPSGLFTTLEDADDALVLLMDSMRWLSDLAEDYAAPMKRRLLKGKELLHLTAYVMLVTDANNIVGRDRAEMYSALVKLIDLVVDTMPEPRFKVKQSPRKTKAKKPAPDSKAKKKAKKKAKEPPRERQPSDFVNKVLDFQQAQPQLYEELMSRLAELHRFHKQS